MVTSRWSLSGCVGADLGPYRGFTWYIGADASVAPRPTNPRVMYTAPISEASFPKLAAR
jgi:hypothetical protein